MGDLIAICLLVVLVLGICNTLRPKGPGSRHPRGRDHHHRQY